jgi:hypothetical protein
MTNPPLTPAIPSAPDGVDPEDWSELAETVRTWAMTGFIAPADLSQHIADYTDGSDEYERVSESDAEALIDAVVAQLRVEQLAWTGESDSDRLDRAFAALEAENIVARMNFTCCGTCGSDEIGDEVPEGTTARGYAFFHSQDADGLAEGGDLCLSYGVFRPADLPDGLDEKALEERWRTDVTALANRVVEVLCAQGLAASWNQDPGRRIKVDIMDWRRRLPVE